MNAASRMSEVAARQNAFHNALGRFVNEGCLSARQRRAALFAPRHVERSAARSLTGSMDHLLVQPPVLDTPVAVDVQPYRGNNPNVQAMMQTLSDVADDVVGAYVHGSLGSYEEVPYSDFDALVILRNAAFDTPERLRRVASRLRKAQVHMFRQDPLQHHGWFVLTEYDLAHFSEAFFPAVLFQYAKALLPGRGEYLTLHPRDATVELRAAFEHLARAAVRYTHALQKPRTFYQLKSLLSRIMLLPSLYVQARDGRGIWKADSFEAARPDFDADSWAVMEEASDLRARWSPPEFEGWRGRMVTATGLYGHYSRKWLSPPVPDVAHVLPSPLFYERVGAWVERAREVLGTATTSSATSF